MAGVDSVTRMDHKLQHPHAFPSPFRLKRAPAIEFWPFYSMRRAAHTVEAFQTETPALYVAK